MSRLLVLDFDGTMTDAEAEGAPFREGYLADLATLTGRPLPEIEQLAQRFEAEIAADPQSYGWMYDGRIVAPATVDPYLRIMPVARKVFDATGTFRSEADRTRLLDGILYKYNYPKTRIAFRPGAAMVLERLSQRDDLDVVVVTNSHTDAVQHKLRILGGGGPRPDGTVDDGRLASLVASVQGRAKKYVIDAKWTAVPESMALPGLNRPVLLRRAHYHGVLAQLLADRGLEWADLLVIGDIFELDLCLPWHMGARIGLVINQHTPGYERAFLAADGRGTLVTDLSEILQLVG